MTTENDYVSKIKALMDELRMAKETIKTMEEKQKKDEKTMKSQFEHMMKLQEKCKELKAQALGVAPTNGLGVPGVKAKPVGAPEDKDQKILDLQDRLAQAEKNKDILTQAHETQAKTARQSKARYEAQIKELNAKIEKLEVDLKEKT